jgi:hypothetical protein
MSDPDAFVPQGREDHACQLPPVWPNQLGVADNARILATIASHIAPAIGWTLGVVAGQLT